jgi:hypothetical protein
MTSCFWQRGFLTTNHANHMCSQDIRKVLTDFFLDPRYFYQTTVKYLLVANWMSTGAWRCARRCEMKAGNRVYSKRETVRKLCWELSKWRTSASLGFNGVVYYQEWLGHIVASSWGRPTYLRLGFVGDSRRATLPRLLFGNYRRTLNTYKYLHVLVILSASYCWFSS